MIRLALSSDLPRLLELFAQFHFSTPLSHWPMSEPKVRELLQSILETKDGLCLVVDHGGIVIGFLIALVSEPLFSEKRIANELAWWVDPSYKSKEGLDLQKAYEYWARNIAKADAIYIGVLNNETGDRLKKLHHRRGYRKVDETWLWQL